MADRPAPAERVVLRSYEYHDADGAVLYEVQRLAPKAFRERRSDGSGGWAYNLNGTKRVLYRLPRVLEAARAGGRVWVVGGEKDVETLEKLGHVATCSPEGPGKWRPEFAQALRGAKAGVVASSYDAGYRHALTVAASLDSVGVQTTVLQFACGCRDITQHVDRGHPLKDLRPFSRAAAQAALERGTKPSEACEHCGGPGDLYTAPGGLARVCAKCLSYALEAQAALEAEARGDLGQGARKRPRIVSAREFCARPAPDGEMQLLGPMVWRTMRVSIGALTGEGKTTMGVQMVRAIVRGEPFLDWRGPGGARALVVDVEQGEETVKQRLRDVGLDEDPNVDILWEPDGLALDQSDEDRRYVEDGLRAGRYDVALFDPLYQLHCGDENSERTAADLMRVLDGWARDCRMGIIIPMHRRKPHAQAGLNSFNINDIGGHTAWIRNSEIVLGLQFHHPGRSWLRFFKDRPGLLPGVGERWTLSHERGPRPFARVTEEDESGWQQTKKALTATPGLTTAELADQFGVKPETIRRHCRLIEAHADDARLPLAEQRWQMEPWPSLEQPLWDQEGAMG